jgi:transaldolase/glucose-6-phosphate isomerase
MSGSFFDQMAVPEFTDASGAQAYLGKNIAVAAREQLSNWKHDKVIDRLGQHDASLWTNRDEAQWLGWLDIVDFSKSNIAVLSDLATSLHEEDIAHVVLLGMGGSSLGPEVIAKTSSPRPNKPALLVLDSTDPGSIRSVEARIDLRRTLFIVSSKSGSTLETNQLCAHFFKRAQVVTGKSSGAHFIAVTDPGTTLEQFAAENGFRAVFHGIPDIGGRFSVLSNFGLVPAAMAGFDVEALLDSAARMRYMCGLATSAADNPGLFLGAIIGKACQLGQDKLTLIAPPEFAAFGAWLEQLVAESTGKAGAGIIPVDLEPLGIPTSYGNDRLFVQYYFADSSDIDQDRQCASLLKTGHPLIRIPLSKTNALGAEFFRWQFATALSATILQVNPFDQPDVESSKRNTKTLMEDRTIGSDQGFVAPPIRCQNADISLYTDDQNWQRLSNKHAACSSLSQHVNAFFGQIRAGDYFAILAYIEMSEANRSALQSIRCHIRDTYGIATCLEFGPRFLHSTGQLYKGGPNTGVFLQITCDDAIDIKIEASGHSFGKIKAAQAFGDFTALSERNRRLLGVHLGKNVAQGLQSLMTNIAAVPSSIK